MMNVVKAATKVISVLSEAFPTCTIYQFNGCTGSFPNTTFPINCTPFIAWYLIKLGSTPLDKQNNNLVLQITACVYILQTALLMPWSHMMRPPYTVLRSAVCRCDFYKSYGVAVCGSSVHKCYGDRTAIVMISSSSRLLRSHKGAVRPPQGRRETTASVP